MLTNWINANDTLQQLFLARMLILAAAIGMGVAVFGIGAIVVRCVEAARLRFGRRTPSVVGVRGYQRAVN